MSMREYLYTHPIFRFDEFEAWKRELGPIVDASVHSAIHYYIKTGQLKRIRRELFGVVPPNATVDDVMFDTFLIAGKVVEDSVLAYHTALELHAVAYSLFEQRMFLTDKKVKSFGLSDVWYQAVRPPKALKAVNQEDFGVEEIDRQGVTIKITNLSRTYVDAIDRPELCGGWEEVCRSISTMVVLDMEEVLAYCLLRNNATLNAKVGFFLSERQGSFAAPKEILDALQTLTPKSPQYMKETGHQKYKLDKKWNLMVPLNVLNKTWEEPHYDDV